MQSDSNARNLNFDFDESGAEFQPAGFDGAIEGVNDVPIEFFSRKLSDALYRVVEVHCGLVRAVCGDGVEGVRNSDDTGHHGNLVADETVRITPAVHAFVVK